MTNVQELSLGFEIVNVVICGHFIALRLNVQRILK